MGDLGDLDRGLQWSSCVACRRAVLASSTCRADGGRALMFDLVGEGSGRMLFVHGCCFDDDPEWDGGHDD